jgi:L-cysteate sulfo-lyase
MRLPGKVALLLGPTPLVRLDGFSRAIGGPTFWMKRDDLTGLALGGNKLRKLELFMKEAIDQGATHVITLGAIQSNHACQTAAASRKLGLEPVLLLRGPKDAPRTGNLVLDDLFGAEVRLDDAPPDDWGERVRTELVERGLRPYLIPYGGSNALGAIGYFLAARELPPELTFDEIVVTSSSGGTQAGLVLARSNGVLTAPVLGVSVDLDRAAIGAKVKTIAGDAASRFELLPPNDDEVSITDAYIGPGYAIADDRTLEAMKTIAQTEAVIVDPVYTGKMIAAAIDLSRSGRWRESANVLFWHTGGAAALFR